QIIAFSGMFFRPAENGSQAQAFVFRNNMEIQYQDESLNGSFWSIPITGTTNSGELTVASPDARSFILPGIRSYPMLPYGGYWTPPLPAGGLAAYVLAYGLPVWSNRLAPEFDPDSSYATVHAVWLTARSLERYLQAIPTTPNGILALIDGGSGALLGASVPNISEAWPIQYTALANPNPLLAEAAAHILAAATANGTATGNSDPSASFASISSNRSAVPAQLTFTSAGDTIYCSSRWITHDAANLALLLVLVTPAHDLLGPVADSTRNMAIFASLAIFFSFVIGGLVAWAMITVPLRKVTASVQK
ncbi:hypothetical protein HK405_013072, partial [Cladochytrium tenue]